MYLTRLGAFPSHPLMSLGILQAMHTVNRFKENYFKWRVFTQEPPANGFADHSDRSFPQATCAIAINERCSPKTNINWPKSTILMWFSFQQHQLKLEFENILRLKLYLHEAV